jgi:ComF family protein
MNFLIHTYFARILAFIFPDRCTGCGKKEITFCRDCQERSRIKTRDKNSILYLDKLYHWGIYEDKILRQALRRFKFHGTYGLAHPFSDMMKELISPLLSSYKENGILIPIPAHEKSKLVRGYNQAELLAQNLSRKTLIPVNTFALRKVINTKSQTSLSGSERIFNVKNSFSVSNPDAVRNKKILLVDDVTTTGATLSEAARVLKQAGALEVAGLVIAK